MKWTVGARLSQLFPVVCKVISFHALQMAPLWDTTHHSLNWDAGEQPLQRIVLEKGTNGTGELYPTPKFKYVHLMCCTLQNAAYY